MNKSSFLKIIVCLTVLALAGVSCQKGGAESKPADVDYYTCTMHPSVRSQDPHGKCPICGMDLVPVKKKSEPAAAEVQEKPGSFTVPVERQQQIGVTYAVVTNQPFRHTLRAVGLVAPDLQRHWEYVPRVDAYVEKLFVFSPGEAVESNAPLATIYSPELFTAQKEFINALQMPGGSNDLVAAAREQLRLWNITDPQISELEQNHQPHEYLTLYSPFKGVVESIGTPQGGKVMAGAPLVGIADLSTVWVWAQFYQEDIPMLKKGLPVRITDSTHPNEALDGKISLIDPFLDDATRTVRARIDVANPGLKLRPDMYVDVHLTMDMGSGLAVPVDAVLPTGLHNIAFVDKGGGRLEARYIEIGREYGGFYEVKGGLAEGERVVSSANFLIDAEAQVQGALKGW